MPYQPTFTAPALTDNAAGTVNVDIQDAGAVYDQANANRARSSLTARYNALRAAALAAKSTRGGGYRPIGTSNPITNALTVTGTTIPQAGVAYSEANEEEFRANIADALNTLISDLNTGVKFLSGPDPSALAALTNSTGRTPINSVGNPGAIHVQDNANDARASLLNVMNTVATTLGA